jgi:hypothetical protein
MTTGKTDAYIDGWSAHRSGVSVDDNPYNEETQSYSHKQWTAGWCERHGQAKHDLLVEELDEEWP